MKISELNLIDKIKFFFAEILADIISVFVLLIPKRVDILINLTEKIAWNPEHKKSIREFRKGPWARLAKTILNNLNPSSRICLVRNLAIRFLITTDIMRATIIKKGGVAPSFFVISPTMRCNLNCIGCYAGSYNQKEELDQKLMERIIKEGKKLYINFFTISGGEPFVYKPLLDIFRKYHDCYFLVYTNGTLIDRKLAKKLSKLGNVAPAVSIEGDANLTDFRRGKGIYKKILNAFENLKREKVFFGFSVTLTKRNAEYVTNDEFIDFLISQGCLFGWFFQYIPIGRNPEIELMATPEQRIKLGQKVREWRETKPIFLGDFWNDGPAVKGCMAGGRLYFHINSNGDVEPCVFIHFAVDNIKNKTIKECLESPFFKKIREKQKTISNWQAPCIIIDHPEILRECVQICQAKPTHNGAETIINDLKIKKHLDWYSEKMNELINS